MLLRQTVIAALTFLVLCAPAPAQDGQSFKAFVDELWSDAQAKGITRDTFDAAMAGVTPDQRVIAATRRQPEYGKPVGDYINAIVSARRVANGKMLAGKWAQTFDAVEKKFGVERYILLAIWGMESAYGGYKAKWDPFRSLTTLAYIRYRHPYFRKELIVAMGILQDGHNSRAGMASSWAGAMGQTQFMPSNFVDYAIDFSGDGRRDIWKNIPDILGSTANYLNKWKWDRDTPWGFEVTVPKGFDYRKSRASFAEWNKLGVRRADGRPFPKNGNGILFFPSGGAGPGFVVTKNFDVLKEYNNSDAYALAVGHLADRINGAAPFRGAWPKVDPQLPRNARVALQYKLAELGHKVNEFDAHIDFDLRDSIRIEQVKFGMRPDGHPTDELLQKLGVKYK